MQISSCDGLLVKYFIRCNTSACCPRPSKAVNCTINHGSILGISLLNSLIATHELIRCR